MTGKGRVLQFQVTLQGVVPPIWRRLEVLASCSFWDLHVAIQDAMGWQDRHLHVFRVDDREAQDTVLFGIPTDRLVESVPVTLPGWKHPIALYFSEPGTSVAYEYDFGDGWLHEILLEGTSPRIVGKKYPVCLEGAGACPPEDCGGIPGFEELLTAFHDSSHEEHSMVRERLGREYDPSAFHPKSVEFDDPRKRWRRAFGKQGRRSR